ncbi:probable RNA-dependent RNA polymerase 1 [Mangifera indica]|uniref:probable RNA-dependent RNA polymerase 1 n=1 Tax=Mangifera indica TaxID=29780 RepID=UPI001CFA33F6|nr:probable RNA-dependent RNA polymerase 1 [Mangifera indica]XP_044480606.1 probable RNA-dependent RNA polymerase 1 [Mangifera indica]
MAKTISLFGFASIKPEIAVKEFVEGYTGKGTVYDVVKVKPKKGSRAYAIVEFTTMEAAEYIVSMAAERLIWDGDSYLKARYVDHDRNSAMEKTPQDRTDNARLNFGCQISEEKFYVLWSQENVSVKFDSDLRNFSFFLTYDSVDYKLKVPYETIWQIQLQRPHDQSVKFLVIQLYGAPLIYKRESHWDRTVDFTPSSSIGQSSAMCLELPGGDHVPKALKDFFFYKESPGKFSLKKGSTFSCNSDLVPIISPPQGIDLPFKILFKINSLIQHGCIPGPVLDVKFFRFFDPSRMDIAFIEHALEKLFNLRECCYDPVSWLKDQYKNYSKSKTLLGSPPIALDDGLAYVHKVFVTPTKIYFRGPEVSLSNRVLRSYPDDIDNFLRVSFVDEDMDRLFSTVLSPKASGKKRTRIYQRILSTLRNGIVIGDKKFETLAFSNSQVRENTLWMFASRPGLTAADIRKSLGDFREIKNVARFAARLGQSLSASRVAVPVDRKDIEIIPDVEVKRKGIKYVFSDGIGKISSELAQEVAKKCGFTSYTPSAFQIRYAGFKGVVAVDPNSSVKLSLRHSMLKYESDSTSLDILDNSKYQSYFLNRQLITLLSTLGIKDGVFERKQREAIAQLDAILTDPSRALEALGLMCSGESANVLKEMLRCDYRPDEEPFLSLMLQTYRASSLQDLRTKARIFLPKGRNMMGTLDETGTLKYGQIFVQYSHSRSSHFSDDFYFQSRGNASNQTSVCEGKVVVAKNPCLHPGDMRVLEAVDVPALHHMVDCVVFPAKGKRPHPNECSGSDLDGDMYFVCWDPDLIPPYQFRPMDYTPGKAKVFHRDVTIEDVEEYFVDFIVNDSLGIINHAHVVFADKEPEKARSTQCLQLARQASIAVDFPKTGVAAKIPSELRVNKYPDFMDKPDYMTYQSERVMGRLYREVKGIAPHATAIKSFTKEIALRSFDSDMEVDGFKKYVNEALHYKCKYDTRLSNLMKHYGIETEAEIVSGYIIKIAKGFDKRGDLDTITSATRSIRKEARAWFNESSESGSSNSDGNDAYAKASAWYYVTYHHSYWGYCIKEGISREHFLSFPWCIYDTLIEIKGKKKRKMSG